MARADHIFVRRFNGVYKHHGVDCGDGSVIHYTSPGWRDRRCIERTAMEDFSRGDELEVVDYEAFQQTLAQKDRMEELLRSSRRRIYRMLDSLRGLAVDELDAGDDAVIARAESRLGESSFDLISNNCEHFAAWCKTGISNSEQIEAVWKASVSGPMFFTRSTQHLLTELFENPWRR
jgi:hypothetical protein